MVSHFCRLAALLLLLVLPAAAHAQDKGAQDKAPQDTSSVLLFRVVTVKDDVTVGFSREQIAAMGAGASNVEIVSRELARQGQMPAWQYAVTKKDGESRMAPLRQVVLFAANTARVEPFSAAWPVLPQPK